MNKRWKKERRKEGKERRKEKKENVEQVAENHIQALRLPVWSPNLFWQAYYSFTNCALCPRPSTSVSFPQTIYFRQQWEFTQHPVRPRSPSQFLYFTDEGNKTEKQTLDLCLPKSELSLSQDNLVQGLAAVTRQEPGQEASRPDGCSFWH